ncbi:right-handed parallel beta-helix repeat-containing protein, partial [bacterium]|nr:right-handed parallel beta-helix repeat-containing protein [bacterium]
MKWPITGLLILCLTQASFAVLVLGTCNLEHATVHNQTRVLFTAISPWAETDSVFTDEDGDFSIELIYGTYDVEYSHDGYVPVMFENITFIIPTVLPTQTLLIETSPLSGALTGTLGPGTYHIVDTISVELGSSLTLVPGTRFFFDDPYPFLIYGTLTAQGIEGDSIIFTTDTMYNPDRWFGLQFKNDGSSGSSLTYCIIENGLASSPPQTGGGGAYCDTASPHFEHCKFRFNDGNGAECRFSSATFTNCTFRGNSGNGVRCGVGSSCAFTSCLFTKNYIRGIRDIARSQFTDCQITKNYSGGVSIDSSHFTRCIISGNAADVGAGVYCGPAPLLEECTITGNLAHLHGGGIAAWGGAPILVNCILNNNIAIEYGGGVLCRVQTALGFVNCTISGNTASIGGGIYCENSSPAFNSTIVSFSEGSGVHFINSAGSQFAFCDFYGNSAGNITFEENDPSEGPANIGVLALQNANGDSCDIYKNIFLNPLFADASERDYRLRTSSPCIDAGDPNLPHNPDNTVADIGALYYDQRFHPPSAFGLAAPLSGDTCWTLDTTLVWYTA